LDAVAPPAEVRAVRETSVAIERQLRDLREGVMRVRMVPVREVFARMQFVVRDLVREIGKRVVLRFSGEETQIDKFVVERIMDPLLHLVRNAVSHGLELPAERLAAGKPAEGQLHLRAKATGETVIVEVEDDGRGIQAEQVLAHARALGLGSQLNLEAASLLDVLCVPGFSTREQSDRVSGRGIGMDVVRKSIEELGGALSLETSPGQGSRFEIQLPLTLAITDALIVKAGPERFAVPQVAVREIIRIESGSSTLIENNELLNYRKGVLPLVRLSSLFGNGASPADEHYALVVGEAAQGIAIVVDRVLGLREIVVRPLTDRLVQVPHIAGATELGDGRVVLILDTTNLSRGARKPATSATARIGTVDHARLAEKKHAS
jgi:two-component system chemotaxis sensor kinase CheA